MNSWTRFRMAVHNFIKRSWLTILVIVFVWLIVIYINKTLEKNPDRNAKTNIYQPDTSIVNDNGSASPKKAKQISEAIEKFYGFCNKNDYDSAYNMLTDDCKRVVYYNNIENFKLYERSVFDASKKYYYQSYSRVGDIYIYDFYVMNDIEKTGGADGIGDFREKLAIQKVGDDWKISDQGYVGRHIYNKVAENNELQVVVTSKDMYYKKEQYNVAITNKTKDYLVIANGSYIDEVTLNLGDQRRNATNTGGATNIVIAPNSTKSVSFIFDKFFDDGKDPTELNLNAVRAFAGATEGAQAKETYSFNVKLE